MTRLDIPERCADITPEWLTEALTSSGVLVGGRVTALRPERLGEDEGFMGEVNRLHLELTPAEAKGPATVIAKQPISIPSHRAQGELVGIYEREILFYRELAAALPVRTARHYFSVMDPNPMPAEQQERVQQRVDALPFWLLRGLLGFSTWMSRFSRRRYLLLLEDLAPAQIGDQLADCSLERAGRCLDALATMQASQWNAPELEALGWLRRTNSAEHVVRAMYLRARRRFEASFGSRIPDEIRGLADWLEQEVVALADRACEAPFTLVHGDFRLDNLFFSAEGAEPEVIFADWQVPSLGPGVYDVAYFLTSTLAPDVDGDAEIALVRQYHDRLQSCGVRDYPLDKCLLDYQRCVLWMLSRSITSMDSIQLADQRGTEMVERWIERLFARMRGLDPAALMGEVEERGGLQG